MQNLRVTLVQDAIVWEDKDANLERFSKNLESIREETDLIVLPETFNTGFSMNAEKLAEEMDGKSVEWLAAEARKNQAAMVASLLIKQGSQYFNRLVWMNPDSSFLTYDKRHLFSMADEHLYYTSGGERRIARCKGWRILPLICYDLRFPVWSRYRGDYDVLLYTANWPKPRRQAWTTLLSARAIENQSYVIGMNRVGEDPLGRIYVGDSMVLDAAGAVIGRTESSGREITTVSLAYQPLVDFRKEFPFFRDADSFQIT